MLVLTLTLASKLINVDTNDIALYETEETSLKY